MVFYGIPPEQAAKPADVKIPLQAHFANKDDWCTPQLVDGFEKAMKAAGKSLELFRYDAEHAFVNEQRQSVHDRAGRRTGLGQGDGVFQEASGVSSSGEPRLTSGRSRQQTSKPSAGCTIAPA